MTSIEGGTLFFIMKQKMFSIRKAVPSDAAILPTIEHSAAQTFRGHLELGWIADDDVQSEQDHLNYIAQEMEWVAVNNNDQPVAFINIERLQESLHICEVSVCQSWQGKGVGRRLIQQVVEFALLEGVRSVTLTTFREIAWNAPYYQRLGFSIVEASELTTDLASILQQEVNAGFNAEQRCAMRLNIIR